MKRILMAALAALAFAPLAAPTARAQQICWFDSSWTAPRFNRANLNGTNIHRVPLSAHTLPQGLGLDVVTGKVYGGELQYSGARLQQSDFPVSTFAPIVSSLSCVRGVAVDAAGGKVYWCSTNLVTGSLIQRANLNGSSPQVLYSYGVAAAGAPRGLALDAAHGMLYVAEFNTGRIRKVPMAGGAPVDVLTGLAGPSGIAIDAAAGRMYWAETNANSIRRANLDGTSVTTLVSGLDAPQYLALDIPDHTMFWTEIGTPRIQKADISGTGVTLLPITTGDPTGIAFVPTNITAVPPAALPRAAMFALAPVRPNPARGAVRLEFELASQGMASLEVFDLSGRKVRTLVRGSASPGPASVHWDGRGEGGQPVAAGTYFARLASGGAVATRRIVLVR